MGRHNKRRSVRRQSPARGWWRTVSLVTTALLGVGIMAGLFFSRAGRPPGDNAGSHDHPPGPHGGPVIAIDRDNRFHVEAVLEAGGLIRLYTFGGDLSEVKPVAAHTVCAAVRKHDRAEEYAVMLQADAQPGDPPGMSSRFVGRLPPSLWADHLRLVVWSLPVDGQRFLFEMDASGTPPDPTTAREALDRETALHTTPGGKYSEEDIRANGRTVAAQKYRGQRSAHDDKPTAGERVCPVSRSKANQRFVWVIGGKEYLFCCPPCIDEFVATAKEKPDQVRDPEFYTHK